MASCHLNGQSDMGHFFRMLSFKSSDRTTFIYRSLALCAGWYLSYRLFALIKIGYPDKTGIHEFFSYFFPFFLLFLLAEVLLPRLKTLRWGKVGAIAFFTAVFFYALNKIQIVLLLAQFFDLAALDWCRYIFSFLPIVLLSVLVVVCSVRYEGDRKSDERPPLSWISFTVLLFLISQVIGFHESTLYLTQGQMVRHARFASLERQMEIAHNYAVGIGVGKNIDKAIHWYEEAFKKGVPDAAYFAAVSYAEKGENDKASEWYSIAANSGSDRAKHIIDHGIAAAVRNSKNKAVDSGVCESGKSTFNVEECRELAWAGYEDAQYSLAKYLELVYREDASLPLTNISFWYERAALAGNKEAISRMGDVYEYGVYEQPDFVKAEHWHSRAIEAGYVWRIPHEKLLNLINNIRRIK